MFLLCLRFQLGFVVKTKKRQVHDITFWTLFSYELRCINKFMWAWGPWVLIEMGTCLLLKCPFEYACVGMQKCSNDNSPQKW